MDIKSKVLILALILLILASAIMTYYRTMVIHDYLIINTEEASSGVE